MKRFWPCLIRDASLYALILIMAWGLKSHYSHAGSDDLVWILSPTAGIVSAISGMDFEREAGSGYMSRDRRVLIAPACAGINFFIIAFSMSAFYIVHRLDRIKRQLLWIGIIGVGAYGFTLVVNAVRIALSLYLFDADIYHGWLTMTRVHRIEGIVVYLTFLCVFFQLVRYAAGLMPRMSCRKEKIPPHQTFRFMERVPSGLNPFGWYVAVTLLVPVINGAYRADPSRFSEHAVTILTAGLVILMVFSGIKVCRKNLTGVLGAKNPGRIGRDFYRTKRGQQ